MKGFLQRGKMLWGFVDHSLFIYVVVILNILLLMRNENFQILKSNNKAGASNQILEDFYM